MSDFVTIAGRPYPVQIQGAVENEREYAGERVRAFSNVLISSKDPLSRKRSWAFVLGPIARAAYDLLHADVDGDASVLCGGDAIGADVACFVDVTGQYTRDRLAHQMVAAVTIHEI